MRRPGTALPNRSCAGTIAAALFPIVAAAVALAAVPVAAEPAAAVSVYDPARDAAADIEGALAAARGSGRHVLRSVGGDWCRDCRDLDALFRSDAALAALRDDRYLVVKVFVGSENRNEAVLARYPKLNCVPTLIELSDSGPVLRFVPTTEFHEGDKLSPARVQAFFAGN